MPFNTKSHSERNAEHAAQKLAVVERHAAEVQQIENARRTADEKRAADVAQLDLDHELSLQSSTWALQKAALLALAAPVEKYCTDPGRPAAIAIGEAIRDLDARSRHELGHGLGDSIAHAMCARAIKLDKTGRALRAFANVGNFRSPIEPNVLTLSERIVKAAVAGDVPALQDNLQRLEVALSQIAISGSLVQAEYAERLWQIIRAGGSRRAIDQALTEVSREQDRVRNEAAGVAMAAIHAPANRGKHVRANAVLDVVAPVGGEFRQ